MKQISLVQVVKDHPYLEQINDVKLENKTISSAEISRLGMELNGFLEHYEDKRAQLYGLQEFEFLKNTKISEDLLKKLLTKNVPFIIFARNQRPQKKFEKIATQQNIPIFVTKRITSKVFSSLYEYLEDKLAPETLVHGVMMSIYGTGVLIKGESGIGKSEVALELIKKGHVLVADDSVKLRQLDSETLISSAPDLLKNKMEIRGIGIVDIQKLFGVTSVKIEQPLDLIVELTKEKTNIERVGNKHKEEKILEVSKKKISIPVLTGKNISNLVEVAVGDYQLKNDYNYDAAQEFVDKLNNMLIEKRDSENT